MDESLMFTAIAMAFAIEPLASIKSTLYLEYTNKWENDDLMALDNAIMEFTKCRRSAYSTPRNIILTIEGEL